MIGPWKISINNFQYQSQSLTCIDPVIYLPEVIPVDNASSKTVTEAFEDGWLSRYPSPLRCIDANGNEFLGTEYTRMLQKNKIKSVPTTVKNPQTNAIVEKHHDMYLCLIDDNISFWKIRSNIINKMKQNK